MSVAKGIRQRLQAATPVDKYVVWSVLILCAIGIVAVYSAISFFAETRTTGDTERMLFAHVKRVGLALSLMLAFSFVDYHHLARLSRIALLLSCGLLIAVPMVGVASGGASRWISLGSF